MNQLKLFFIFSVCIFASACSGMVPRAYQGKFVDASQGAELELKAGEGTLKMSSGRQIQAKSDALDFDKLSKATAGIYLNQNAVDKSKLEVYWIGPKAETRKEEGGLVWFESEVLYTLMDTRARRFNEGDVSSFDLTQCENGTLLLDPSTKRWEIGCPAGPLLYHLTRVQE